MILPRKSNSGAADVAPSLVRRAVATALSVAVAELVTLPVCTVKTVYMTRDNLRSATHAAAWIWTQGGGLAGFFRASAPAVSAQVLTSTSKLILYRDLQRARAERGWTSGSSDADNVACAVAAGLATAVVTHPLDVLRVKLQTHQTHAVLVLSPRAAYLGFSKTASKVLVSSPLFFPINDAARGYFAEHGGLSLDAQRLLAACTSAVVSTTLMHPLEYLKTTHIHAGHATYHGWNVARYFRGLPLNLARVVPHFCIFIAGSEWLLAHWGGVH